MRITDRFSQVLWYPAPLLYWKVYDDNSCAAKNRQRWHFTPQTGVVIPHLDTVSASQAGAARFGCSDYADPDRNLRAGDHHA
jgi:hypothetical protein